MSKILQLPGFCDIFPNRTRNSHSDTTVIKINKKNDSFAFLPRYCSNFAISFALQWSTAFINMDGNERKADYYLHKHPRVYMLPICRTNTNGITAKKMYNSKQPGIIVLHSIHIHREQAEKGQFKAGHAFEYIILWLLVQLKLKLLNR